MAKITNLQKGLIFDAQLSDRYLQTATLPSDTSHLHAHATALDSTATYGSLGATLTGGGIHFGNVDPDNFGSTRTTVELSVRFTSVAAFKVLCGTGDAFSTTEGWALGTRSIGSDIVLSFRQAWSTGTYRRSGVTKLQTGVDYHIVFSYDASTPSSAVIRVNGVGETGTTNELGIGTADVGTDGFRVGASQVGTDGASAIFWGVRQWNRLLSSDEQAELYLAYRSRIQARISTLQKGLVFHAPLTDRYLQTATLASDIGPRHGHATSITNTPTYSAAGVALGNDDLVEMPLNGALDTDSVTIGMRLTPDTAYDDNDNREFFATTTGSGTRWSMLKLPDSGLNGIRIRVADTVIGTIAAGYVAAHWVVGQEMTFALTTTESSPLTNVWINGVHVFVNYTTAYTRGTGPTTLYVGGLAVLDFNGTQRDIRIWNRILDATEIQQYHAGFGLR